MQKTIVPNVTTNLLSLLSKILSVQVFLGSLTFFVTIAAIFACLCKLEAVGISNKITINDRDNLKVHGRDQCHV